jgi:predicted phage terminase large subunit-like protein
MIFDKHLTQSLARSPGAAARAKWLATARPSQITPGGDWRTWLVLAGRGFGKTRLGAEDVAWYAATHPGHQIAVVAPTFNDVRGTCFEGVSGLIACAPRELIEDYNRTNQELKFTNGAMIRGFSAEKPDRLRGPQFHRAWCDELAAWQHPDALDQLRFGLRLGVNPRMIVTTTPRPTPMVRNLIAQPGTIITRGSTFDNAANLAPEALADLRARLEGTRLGRQELYAEMLDDLPGALWARDAFDMHRVAAPPDMARVVVAVDPSGTAGASDTGDSIGIVVAGKGIDGRAYVLADRTCKLSPDGWGRRAVDAYREHGADRIVAERNFGGAMVAHVIRTVDPRVSYKEVTASRGKVARAEPVAALYEQGRVSHIGGLSDLEDQLCAFGPDGYAGEGSPDRADALVWALTELMLAPAAEPFRWHIAKDRE